MILHNGDVLFGWPLQSHVITAGWFYNDGSLHRALDFRAAVGTPVYAAADGTVETAYRWNGRRTQGDTNSYGNMLKLRHADYRGGRLETLYAHLSKLCVAQGETVYEGQLGGYQSVARPAAEKTQPVQMQTVTVGPISNGDAARLYALCGDLGLVESGLYHAAYTEV